MSSTVSDLPVQRVEELNVETLDPYNPVVMAHQATVNIGTIGHVQHGKSTVVKSISGTNTIRFKDERFMNITIKLGYANAKIFKCDNAACLRPDNYRSFPSSMNQMKPTCLKCNSPMTLQRHVSFVDCPGHELLMATMLNGAAVMDAALLLIAGNESCPQLQTSEHLAAVEIMKLRNIIILQNKIDLVKEKEAASQYDEILNFVRGTVADGAPIIPISAQLKYNIEVVCEYLCTKIPKPIRDFTSSPRFVVIRSFDVNLPGDDVENLKGGVAGGSILRGVLKLGQAVEVRPGFITRDSENRTKCLTVYSHVLSLKAESNPLAYAVPGGLIGVGTRIDPNLTRADRLVGQVIGEVGKLPEVFAEIEISYFLLRHLLGVRTDPNVKKSGRIAKLERGEMLMVNIGSTSTGARVLSVKGDLAKFVLTTPVCSFEGEKLALSRRVDKHWRLIGWGIIRRGVTISEEGEEEEELETNA